jgi:hypothetical protein
VGVDYHAYGTDFLHTAFITIYNQSEVRQTVKTQLQGMADRGATVISTRIWFVTEPGTTNFGETWRATFPMSDQEQANLRAYAQDVAAIQGSGGNRLRLDLCFLWLGAADYTKGSPSEIGYVLDHAGRWRHRGQHRLPVRIRGLLSPPVVPMQLGKAFAKSRRKLWFG